MIVRKAKIGFEKAFENAQELQANLDNDVKAMFESRQNEINKLFEISSDEIVEKNPNECEEQELENYEEQNY